MLLYSNFCGLLFSRNCQARKTGEIKGMRKKRVLQYCHTHCFSLKLLGSNEVTTTKNQWRSQRIAVTTNWATKARQQLTKLHLKSRNLQLHMQHWQWVYCTICKNNKKWYSNTAMLASNRCNIVLKRKVCSKKSLKKLPISWSSAFTTTWKARELILVGWLGNRCPRQHRINTHCFHYQRIPTAEKQHSHEKINCKTKWITTTLITANGDRNKIGYRQVLIFLIRCRNSSKSLLFNFAYDEITSRITTQYMRSQCKQMPMSTCNLLQCKLWI